MQYKKRLPNISILKNLYTRFHQVQVGHPILTEI